ncbi:DUF2218 domain-containing protein [Corynebacterium halotolerans]|uniref:DUF2218 domain-containing protein n=1 Tax=Corynebacterium halotolerans YIM 70093 = DSM 44683 TaxID=1121362 RepID=M1MWH9_9CORY|nr:DUF2218 domain-containing protein [Corynebacterium halotolerans]AGF72089.1 hypothetical protein A605_05415 [Corynebacterium halotolerans YIM 70093 = DSM 44683]
MTASSTARVKTDRPGRYGKQLASHFSTKLQTSWDAESGRGHLTFAGEAIGEVDMVVGDRVLLLHLECDEDALDRLERVVGVHLVRFGTRDGLEVAWRRRGGDEGTRWTAADLEG